MSSHVRSIEDAAAVSEDELGALLQAYYDELSAALRTWGVPRELREPAKRIFSVARQHAGRAPGSVEAWGLTPWAPIADRTPAELLREPGGDLIILQALAGH